MPTRNQVENDELTIEFHLTDEARAVWPDEPLRRVTLSGYAASAYRKLFNAGKFGVHQSEYRRDALARFDQAGVTYETFSDRRRGTGETRCWCRLVIPDIFKLQVVEGSVA